jgi:hypothetical protein
MEIKRLSANAVALGLGKNSFYRVLCGYASEVNLAEFDCVLMHSFETAEQLFGTIYEAAKSQPSDSSDSLRFPYLYLPAGIHQLLLTNLILPIKRLSQTVRIQPFGFGEYLPLYCGWNFRAFPNGSLISGVFYSLERLGQTVIILDDQTTDSAFTASHNTECFKNAQYVIASESVGSSNSANQQKLLKSLSAKIETVDDQSDTTILVNDWNTLFQLRNLALQKSSKMIAFDEAFSDYLKKIHEIFEFLPKSLQLEILDSLQAVPEKRGLLDAPYLRNGRISYEEVNVPKILFRHGGVPASIEISNSLSLTALREFFPQATFITGNFHIPSTKTTKFFSREPILVEGKYQLGFRYDGKVSIVKKVA